MKHKPTLITEIPDEAPEVEAHLSKNGVHLVVKDCPYCGKKHLHGAGENPERPSYGHRVPHCEPVYSRKYPWSVAINFDRINIRGYVLIPPAEACGK
jgi:hypothetical protein